MDLQMLETLLKMIAIAVLMSWILDLLFSFTHEFSHMYTAYLTGCHTELFVIGKAPYIKFRVRTTDFAIGLMPDSGGTLGFNVENNPPTKLQRIAIYFMGPFSAPILVTIITLIMLYPQDAFVFLRATFIELPQMIVGLLIMPNNWFVQGIPYVNSMTNLTTHLSAWVNIALTLLIWNLVAELHNLVPSITRNEFTQKRIPTDGRRVLLILLNRQNDTKFADKISNINAISSVFAATLYCIVVASNIIMYKEQLAHLLHIYLGM